MSWSTCPASIFFEKDRKRIDTQQLGNWNRIRRWGKDIKYRRAKKQSQFRKSLSHGKSLSESVGPSIFHTARPRTNFYSATPIFNLNFKGTPVLYLYLRFNNDSRPHPGSYHILNAANTSRPQKTAHEALVARLHFLFRVFPLVRGSVMSCKQLTREAPKNHPANQQRSSQYV